MISLDTLNAASIRRLACTTHWGKSLTQAFIAGNTMFTQAQRNFPYVTPWMEAELEDTTALMGEDFHPHGYAPN